MKTEEKTIEIHVNHKDIAKSNNTRNNDNKLNRKCSLHYDLLKFICEPFLAHYKL